MFHDQTLTYVLVRVVEFTLIIDSYSNSYIQFQAFFVIAIILAI
jgi:hypothetical protein